MWLENIQPNIQRICLPKFFGIEQMALGSNNLLTFFVFPQNLEAAQLSFVRA